MSTLTYIRTFIKDRHVASITPTSSFGINRLKEDIDFARARVFVEFGPGTGIITRHIVKRMHPEARMVLIERNESFVDILRKEFADARVDVCHDDARNVEAVLKGLGLGSTDYVISGIPFSWLPDEHRDQLVATCHRILAPGGAFLLYQTFWQPDEHLLMPLRRHFRNVSTHFVLLNAPPLRMYRALKEKRATA